MESLVLLFHEAWHRFSCFGKNLQVSVDKQLGTVCKELGSLSG